MAKANPKKAGNKLKNNPATKAISDVFFKIGEKTGMSNKRVDEWQNKWLAVPKNRTKYESLKDAPKVAGEEIFAMFNDIVDFVQREEGGQSHVFKKIKDEGGEFIKNPAVYTQKRAEEGKKKAAKAKKMAGKGSKGGVMAGGLEGLIAKAKSGMAVAKKRASKGMAEARKRAEEAAKKAKK